MAIETAPSPQHPPSLRAARSKLFRRRGVRPRDLMMFLEQLEPAARDRSDAARGAELAARRLPAVPALAGVLDAVVEDIAAGRSFSSALARHPEIFSATYVSLIAASENGGFMPEVLKQLLQLEEKREKLRSTLVAAAAYPAFLERVLDRRRHLRARRRVPAVRNHLREHQGRAADHDEGAHVVQRRPARGVAAACSASSPRRRVLGRRWAASAAGRELLDALKMRAPIVERHIREALPRAVDACDELVARERRERRRDACRV